MLLPCGLALCSPPDWIIRVESHNVASWPKQRAFKMIGKIFTWWNGSTIGALFDIKRRSAFVGEDDYGNRYFEDRKPSIEGRHRRYVLYKGLAEPSKVPADWHGWLHHTFKLPPTVEPLQRRAWETDHKPNMTGTVYADRPKGSLREGGHRAATSADYEAWTPDA